MTAVGGMILLNEVETTVPRILAIIGVGVSFVNVIGGFAVSQRMLNLFKRKEDKDYSPLLLIPGGILHAAAQFGGTSFIRDVNSISALLCIAAIGCLASQKTANSGCKAGMIGVAASMITTLHTLKPDVLMTCAVVLSIGGVLGLIVGLKVSPIAP